jgi:hypothetical protein
MLLVVVVLFWRTDNIGILDIVVARNSPFPARKLSELDGPALLSVPNEENEGQFLK